MPTYAIDRSGLWTWSGTAWTTELADADLGEGYHSLSGVCATDHHVIVVDRSGQAVVRPR